MSRNVCKGTELSPKRSEFCSSSATRLPWDADSHLGMMFPSLTGCNGDAITLHYHDLKLSKQTIS